MDDFQSELISSLEEMKKQKEEDDKLQLIKEQFASMEQRYHTWMNYYSLFNGALLVAYCTILVSTGKVIKEVCEAKICYDLNCTYWGFLVLIACLGVVASYCWYLSMIGHNKWLGNWRSKLQKEEPKIMKDISTESDKLIRGKRKIVLSNFYSTATITRYFVLSVLTGWIIATFYVASKFWKWNMCPLCIVVITILLVAFLLCITRLHKFQLIFGSDISDFTINGNHITKK